ncbi:SMI1/KNR4 family protein [Streptomyces hiroshimensis]|uniref:Cell wall assembly protein n=1 Tax=Streptomyces hiroshimensis TaxID=66424 RepID=A0ABQ2Y8M0_9ACTN|nr:SMI1/KNR4 family protein [Streptomyces hiroshimensis]GGX73347.1 cell wall assembly protein [Streptomyces hiroshimensis]
MAEANDATFEWRPFLARWSEEWADSCDPDDPLRDEEEAARQARWLGFAPASGSQIAALEQRLGRRLPPSYRAFLEVSDGWRNAGGFVDLLAGTGKARWYEDESGFGETYRSVLGEHSSHEEITAAGMWSRALQLDVESDATYVLMDPQDITGDGEWAVYCHKAWSHSPPQRYVSFRAFMKDMYREFHSLRAKESGEAEFVNDTTRALDAVVEEAWHEALSGEYERAGRMLEEPAAYGRPRAQALLGQLRLLLGEIYFHNMGPGLSAEVRTQEYPPAQADDRYHGAYPLHVGRLRHQDAPFHYTAPGPFGAAVEQARDLVRWGDAEAAWHTLLAALPRWQPLDPTHLAPFGLLRDSLLGALLTPEQSRELLAVPRGPKALAGTGSGPGPVAKGLDPGGLAWLADQEQGTILSAGYRFVLVEGTDPAGLPARLGADGDTGLHELMTGWDARRLLHSNDESSIYGDKPVVSVGRAGPGWSFAFDDQPPAFDRERFVSPAVAASHGTRAVVVWSTPAGQDRPSSVVFHLSVAENGEEKYAFTVHGAEIRRSGDIPPALDPDLFYGPVNGATPQAADEAGRASERRALEAIAAEFDVSLPRFVLTRADCLLHRFKTRSWRRPPRPGESFTVWRSGAPAGPCAQH